MEPKQKWTCWKEDGDLQMWACGNGESSYGVWFSDEQQAQAMCDELNNVERLRSQVEAMRVAGKWMAVILTKHAAEVGTRDLGEIEAVQQWDASLNPQGATMNTKLTDKLRELRSLMIVKGDVDLVDECIALASLTIEQGEGPVMPCYDAGLLNDYGGGNVDWWQDYIRAELNRAHDFYQSWWDAAGQAHPKGYVMSRVVEYDEWPASHPPVGGEPTLEQVAIVVREVCGLDEYGDYTMMGNLRARLAPLFTHPKGEVGELTDEAFVKEWLISSGRIISPNGGTLLDEAAQPLCVFLKHARDNGYLTKKS